MAFAAAAVKAGTVGDDVGPVPDITWQQRWQTVGVLEFALRDVEGGNCNLLRTLKLENSRIHKHISTHAGTHTVTHTHTSAEIYHWQRQSCW